MADETLDFLNKTVGDALWNAARDFLNIPPGASETFINTKLAGLTKPDAVAVPLAISPVAIQVASVVPDTSFTALVGGKIPLSDGFSSFARIEVEVSGRIEMTDGPRLKILKWNAVAADVQIGENPIANVVLAVAYVNGSWSGRGKLQFKHAGFGLDLTLGGLSGRGAIVAIGINSVPTMIPIGATGLGMGGVRGELAYNFKPRLIARRGPGTGLATKNPTAMDYAAWAREAHPDRWTPAAPSETAIGVGVGCSVGTLLDNGYLMALDAGLTVLAPGVVFVIGGNGKLLDARSIRAEGYLAIDILSASIGVGVGVEVKVPDDGALFDAAGTLDAFWSFKDPSAWYLHLGTEEKPIRASALKGGLKAALYFMIDPENIALGVAISLGTDFKLWIFRFTFRIGIAVATRMGTNPFQLEGMFALFFQMGIAIWKIRFIVTMALEVKGCTPHPQYLKGKGKMVIDLPWPLPSIDLDREYDNSEDPLVPPILERPLALVKE